MKLVRDKTPDFLSEQDPQIEFSSLPEGDRPNLLTAKLLEEVAEYITAGSGMKRSIELSDILEVLWGLAEMDKLNWNDIETHAYMKRAMRGSFKELQVMKVTTKDEREREKVMVDTQPGVNKTANADYGYSSDSLMYGGGDGPYYSG